MQRQKQIKSGQGLKKKNLPPIWIPVPCLSLQNSGGYNIKLSAPSHSSTRMVNVKSKKLKYKMNKTAIVGFVLWTSFQEYVGHNKI